MKKELLLHYIFTLVFIALVSLLRGWLSLSYWPLWIGAAVGTVMPNIDYLIYAYFLRPQEYLSQRTSYLMAEKNFSKVLEILAHNPRNQGEKLVFHTAYFQLIFLVLTFWVVTSSGSLFGIGLVLAFFLHLLVDQIIDMLKIGNIDFWFKDISVYLAKEKQVFYWLILTIVFLLIGFVF